MVSSHRNTHHQETFSEPAVNKEGDMINSSKRKLALSGWLKEHNNVAYNSPLRLQKFLFLYEGFSKTDGEKAELSGLKGYKRGPVFSAVWGDYTKDRESFEHESVAALQSYGDSINAERAEKASFISSVLSEDELSELTHTLNIWRCKKKQIDNDEKNVSLNESDFNAADVKLLKTLESMYPVDMIQNSVPVRVGEMFFVFPKADMVNLTESHMDVLYTLSHDENLRNPVFAKIDDEGKLCID